MSTDIVLDEEDGNWIVMDALVVKSKASDLQIDCPQRRAAGGPPFRRALVHDANDGLTVNFNGDYPGGVTLFGVAGVYPKRDTSPFGQQLGATPNLSVYGGLNFVWDPGINDQGLQPYTVSLQKLITELQDRITELEQKVQALQS